MSMVCEIIALSCFFCILWIIFSYSLDKESIKIGGLLM